MANAKLFKKDFEEIAQMLANLGGLIPDGISAEDLHYHVVRNLSHILSKTNERFDAEKFEKASGVDK